MCPDVNKVTSIKHCCWHFPDFHLIVKLCFIASFTEVKPCSNSSSKHNPRHALPTDVRPKAIPIEKDMFQVAKGILDGRSYEWSTPLLHGWPTTYVYWFTKKGKVPLVFHSQATFQALLGIPQKQGMVEGFHPVSVGSGAFDETFQNYSRDTFWDS